MTLIRSHSIAALLWRAAGLNLLGLVILGAGSGQFSGNGVAVRWTALFVGLLVVGPLAAGAAERKGLDGPAALLAALTAPVSFLAAFVALLSGLFRFWCPGGCAVVPIAGVALLAAVPIFLVGGVFSFVASRAGLDKLAQRQAKAVVDDEE